MSSWDIANKTVLITGATDGVGYSAAHALAKRGAKVVILARDLARGIEAARRLGRGVEVIACDLASFESIRNAVEEFKRRFSRLQVLINVAGVMPLVREESKDGLELAMAVNYFAPVLLTELLLPLLSSSAPSRIINVTSSMYKNGTIHLDELTGMREYNRYQAYADSKLALMLYTRYLADRLKGNGLVANAVHPGWIRTKLAIRALKKSTLLARLLLPLRMKSPSYGARTIVYLAADPAANTVSGEYFIKNQVSPTKEFAKDLALARALYARTHELLTPYMP